MNDARVHSYHTQYVTDLQLHYSHEAHKEFIKIVMKEIPTGSEVPPVQKHINIETTISLW